MQSGSCQIDAKFNTDYMTQDRNFAGLFQRILEFFIRINIFNLEFKLKVADCFEPEVD